ncbi:MAG: hypothetical protein ABS52_05950 [Gemmatimonadetes bacterium SCN 70-22]|nr:MAG: hypothetical protein ABS52_05950 [Gemmatimonadetes bacterium SCN 70-22]
MAPTPRVHDPGFPTPTADERVLERRYYESGALQYERATLRQLPPPALPPPPVPAEPLWMEAMVWVLGSFGRGLWVVGDLLLGLLAAVAGLIGALVLLALGIAAAIGFVALAAWLGGRFDPEVGRMVGAAVGLAVVLLIVVGAADSSRR